jgi:Ni/Co efflux regulator RcnB
MVMKWMMSLALLATAAAPVLAQDGRPQEGRPQNAGEHGGGNRGGDHGGGRPGQPGAGQPGAGQPGGRPQAPQFQQAPQAPRGAVPDQGRQQFQPRGGADGRGPGGPGGRMDGPGRVAPGGAGGGVQVHRGDGRQPGNWQGDRGPGGPNGFRPDGGGRPDGRDGGRDRGPDGRQAWNGGRPGFDGRPGDDRRGGGWDSGWRNDQRYDWRGYRDSHRNAYHVGGYRAPYGYGAGYRRFGIGGRIDPVFFGQNYWISDPWAYRLPPVSPPYRWVRYYNDALLIDTYSGMVADEIPDFFW